MVDTSRAPRVPIVVCAALIGLGVVILMIPAGDEGRVIVPVSEGHRLSTIDLVGGSLLAIGATWLEVLVVWRLPHLCLPARAVFGLGLPAGLGIGLIVASVFAGFFWWWAVGAAALGVAGLVLVPLTAR